MKEKIRQHAEKHLAGQGRIEILNGHREAYGIYGATVKLTRPDCTDYYHAYADGHGVGMSKTRSEPLPDLPLFAGK